MGELLLVLVIIGAYLLGRRHGITYMKRRQMRLHPPVAPRSIPPSHVRRIK